MATVLVVDDSPTDRRLIGNLLQKTSRLDVIFANDGRQALQVMRDSTTNLVVTDLVMPHMDGLELVTAIVKTYPQIPTVLVSCQGNDRTAARALSVGASSYVPKNMLQDWLLNSVENLLSIALNEHAHIHRTDYPVGCQFSIDNDVTKIPPLIDYLRGFIRRADWCDDLSGIRICVALEEALNNALYHGNLEVDSQLREGDRGFFRNLVEARRSTYPFRNRRIHVTVSVHADHAAIVIRDDGRGFDVAGLPDPTDPRNLQRLSGRGVLLMRTFMDEVHYNVLGNQVTLIKRKQSANSGRESEDCECHHQSTLPSSKKMTF